MSSAFGTCPITKDTATLPVGRSTRRPGLYFKLKILVGQVLSDYLVSYVSQGAEQAGYSSAGEYIAALVAAASEKQGEIEQALMAGIASGPAEPWTDDQ